ncbi:protein yellow-like [Macrosteles quadrilineatus]|uniref:protein yellow-like n=1 Tax=Macrosteles quadrilineatus TaxID=74068 RepID=UPI0023E1538F|nr:protein yellow-like [Macrosteles quadrilineatus]
MIWFVLLECVLGCACSSPPTHGRMHVVVSWPGVDILFSSDAAKNAALANGSYDPSKMTVWSILPYGDRLFLFCPNQFKGTYSTVNFIYMNDVTNIESPKLRPYPPTLNSIVSVFRAVTSCEDYHMYFVDDGVDSFYDVRVRRHPPRLFKVHLPSDTLRHLYTLAPDDYTDTSAFSNLVVDQCGDAYVVYICDLTDYAVVVVDLHRNASHRVRHPYFVMDPFSAFLDTPAGYRHTFLNDGVAALALSPCLEHKSDRTLYFASSGGRHLFAVSTDILRDKTLSSDTSKYRVVGYRGDRSQSNNLVYNTQTDVMLYGTTQENSLYCWNTRKGLTPQTQRLVLRDDAWYRTPNDLQEDCHGGLWALANNWIEGLYRNITGSASVSEGANIVVLKGCARKMASVCTGM